MNVLVTGGAGYVGSVVVEVLIREGFNVVVIDNLSEGHRKAIPDDISLIVDDFGNNNRVKGIISDYKIDAVVHMAGETLVSKSMTHPEDYFRSNVAKGLELLEAMREMGVKRILFSSTAALFGNPEFVPITEEHPTRPINAYGRSKLMFEEMLEWYNKAHGFNFMCLRYFNAAGATEKHGEDHRIETHLIPIILKTALGKREYIEIYGTDYDTKDGTCIRDYIHIEDLAVAHVEGLRRMDDLGPQKLNLGNGDGYSVKEVIETAREITGRKISVKYGDRRHGDPPVLIASSEKAQKLLNLKPGYPSLSQIIDSAWRWHSRYPDGYEE